MTHDFDGSEPWLKMKLEDIQWSDLPAENPQKSRALGILGLRSMDYSDYLLTNHWREVRKVAFARYNGQCLCAKDAREVHHMRYDRKGFEWPGDVVALCSECHALYHATWKIRISHELNR